ncbi:MAG: tetratricopeptide repeat protein, partial [Planctomycetaceae bacterium]
MDSTQYGQRSIRVAGTWLPVWLMLCLGAGQALGQQEAPPAGPAVTPPVRIPGQELEDPIERLQPAEPRTAADAARIDALGWFATGRIFLGRGDLPAAYRSFQRAVEKDDGILAVYRQLIPLALQLNQADQAVKWVQRASELAPDDFEWLVQLTELQIRSENVVGAIQSLERAT